MSFRPKTLNLPIAFYLALAVFAIPHLIDDFLFDIPRDFGISEQAAQVLAGGFILIFMSIFLALARGNELGIYGSMFMGSFLALAGILKHIPLMVRPGPYWSGWFSELLIIGLIISGLGLLLTSIAAWRAARDRAGK